MTIDMCAWAHRSFVPRIFLAPDMDGGGDIRIFLAPDDGSGGGAGGKSDAGDGDDKGDAGDEGDEPKYTDAELKAKIEESMKRHRRQLQRDVKEKDKALEDLRKLADEQKVKAEELEAALATKGDDDPELKGKLELMEKRFTRELKDAQEKITAAQDAQKIAELKSKETRRDTLLRAAITKAGCMPEASDTAFRAMLPEVFMDEVDEDWRMKTPQGNVVGLDEGVKDLLPDYLKPATAQGGSGAKTGSPAKRQIAAELEVEKSKLEKLTIELKARPDNIDLTDRWSFQKRKVEQLVAGLESAK